jgi:ornithine decarboxylase
VVLDDNIIQTLKANAVTIHADDHTAENPVVDIVSEDVQALLYTTAVNADKNESDAFFVVNLADIIAKHTRWTTQLPRVDPFYAVKCNNDPRILQTLASLGVGFDCASKGEIEAALDCGVRSDQIVYANPVKNPAHLRHARGRGVTWSTFDSAEELHKVKANHPESDLLLRIAVDDSASMCQLGNKYGAPVSEVPALLKEAASLGLNIRGLAYHVGSGCYSIQSFVDAVETCSTVFEQAKAEGFDFDVLDIGGGFPGDSEATLCFDDICAALRPALDQHFPEDRGVRILAEPGRYFVGSSHTLAVNIIGRKVMPAVSSPSSDPVVGETSLLQQQQHCLQHSTTAVKAVLGEEQTSQGDKNQNANADVDKPNTVDTVKYFVNDGIYGSFNCIMYDHASCTPYILAPPRPSLKEQLKVRQVDSAKTSNKKVFQSSVWGHTCDGLDCIVENTTDLPLLEPGQWLYFKNMGAYTSAAGSQFNGFDLPNKVYLE